MIILKSVLADSKYSTPNTCASTVTLLSSPINVFILIGSSFIPLPITLLGSFGSFFVYFFSVVCSSFGVDFLGFKSTLLASLSNSFWEAKIELSW